MGLVPKKLFFTKGVGIHKEKLQSFEYALRKAGIQKCNLVMVSSIIPPNCKIVPRKKGLEELLPGQITFCVLESCSTNEPNRLIVSAIGYASPSEKNSYGYLSEHSAYGETEKKAGEYAEDLAATMLASTHGIELDPEKAWDERRQIYRSSKLIVRASNICQSARGNKYGLWTTVIAAAVLYDFE